MINVNVANSQAATLRGCALELQNVINTIDNSLSQISATDPTTAGPVRDALSYERDKTVEAQSLLYELANQIENDAYSIYQAELEAERRRQEERQRQR